MTPPAFARISGTTKIPLSARILSASNVMGPLAASQTTLALTASAFFTVITPSKAAGIRTSTFISRSSSLLMASAAG